MIIQEGISGISGSNCTWTAASTKDKTATIHLSRTEVIYFCITPPKPNRVVRYLNLTCSSWNQTNRPELTSDLTLTSHRMNCFLARRSMLPAYQPLVTYYYLTDLSFKFSAFAKRPICRKPTLTTMPDWHATCDTCNLKIYRKRK